MAPSLISVGLATYNGERFIARALDSLLRQDYGNFEIVVSDNASTDRTGEVVRDYAAREPRVRYARNERNLGSLSNFDRAFELSRGELFMWAGDHDLWEPDTLSTLSAVLRADPGCALAYGRTQIIDGDGKPSFVTPERLDTQGLSPARSYARLVWSLGWCNMLYGLIRASALRAALPFPRVWGADLLLLARLALQGGIAQHDAVLFHRRETRVLQSPAEERRRALTAFDPATSAARSQLSQDALVRELRDAHLDTLRASSLGPVDRAFARAATLLAFRLHHGVSLLPRAERGAPGVATAHRIDPP